MKLLIAEDTKDLNRVVTVMLEHAGYEVDPVFDGEEAMTKIRENGYDGVILDIMMPKKDGITVLKEMRASHINLPVLLLTAKAEVDDRVTGLEAGADDYLPKPFAMKELLARVNAMTRRRTEYALDRLSYADCVLDADKFELASENAARLSIKEFELMQIFVLNPEKVLEESFLLSHIWKNDPDANEDTLYLYVNYLRRKLKMIASRAVITGARGEGYMLAEQDKTL